MAKMKRDAITIPEQVQAIPSNLYNDDVKADNPLPEGFADVKAGTKTATVPAPQSKPLWSDVTVIQRGAR